jgi:hypothetical protein
MTKLLPLALLVACVTSQPIPPVSTPAADFALAGRRAQMIEWLREYDAAGQYPTDARGLPLSVFRDARGMLCPMAWLIHRSGRDDLVDAAVRTNNHLRLADVHAGPLYDWMTSSGLTQPEIAMVQGAMRIELAPDRDAYVIAAAARAEVHGRLETAVIALRDLVRQRTRVAVRTSAASPRSSGTTR